MRVRTSKFIMTALLTSVAFVGPAAAQDATFTLSATGGVIGLNIPNFDSGVFGHSSTGPLFGGMVAGSVTAGLGPVGEYDGFITLSGFGAFATSMGGTYVDTFNGPDGVVVIYGLTTPGAPSEIDLSGATASADVTGPGTANNTSVSTVGGAVGNVNTVSPDGTGFILTSATDDGAAAGSAYGGIGSSTGGIFIASGDFDGLEVTTEVSRSVFYGGVDLTAGLGGSLDNGAGLQVYAGPSYRGILQTNLTGVSVNIPEEPASAITHAEWHMDREDVIKSHYLGGVLGGSLSIPTDTGVVYSLGVEGGLYSVMASWTGQDTYSTCCGFDDLGDPSPDISVTADPVTGAFANQIAFAARGNASASWGIGEGRFITLGAGLEYLSHVAAVSHGSSTTVNTEDEDWVAADGTMTTTTMSWGHMLNATVTASISGTF